MRRRLALLPALVLLASCTRYEGPLEVYEKTRAGDRADLPGYTVPEQRVRARERTTLIEDDPRTLPSGFVDRYGPNGR